MEKTGQREENSTVVCTAVQSRRRLASGLPLQMSVYTPNESKPASLLLSHIYSNIIHIVPLSILCHICETECRRSFFLQRVKD